jgi:hypothetical protein
LSTIGHKKENPLPRFATGSGLKPCCDPWLLSHRFELPHHNRQRAAPVPIMVGVMVQMVAMMGSTETHILLFTSATTGLIRD